jgi:hypothetical protein
MTLTVSKLYTRLRQRIFPVQFRIEVEETGDWVNLLAVVVSEAFTAAKHQKTESGLTKAAKESPPSVDTDFALALCNSHFRLRRNAEQLALEGKDSKELRSITRALKNIDQLFEKYGIESRDLSGQTYHDGRVDFEPIGEPELIPGLDTPKIGRCECPAVLVNGRLIQKARGLATKPA